MFCRVRSSPHKPGAGGGWRAPSGQLASKVMLDPLDSYGHDTIIEPFIHQGYEAVMGVVERFHEREKAEGA